MITEFLECFSSSGFSFKCAFLLFLVLSSSLGSTLDWILQPESCKQRSVGRRVPLFPKERKRKPSRCKVHSELQFCHLSPAALASESSRILALMCVFKSTWEKKASEFRVLFQFCCFFIYYFFATVLGEAGCFFFFFSNSNAGRRVWQPATTNVISASVKCALSVC